MAQVVLEPLHRFHPYCARFPSEVVEAAIAQYTQPGDSIFDPFCGSGTTLVTGLAHGRTVVGADIDILAGMLSEVKCHPFAPQRYAAWRKRFVAQLTSAFADIAHTWKSNRELTPGTTQAVGSLTVRIPQFPELNYWFPPQLIAALATIAEVAHHCQEAHYEQVALLSLSASIIAKWPNTLSYAMDVDHTRPHRRVQQFALDRVLKTYLSRLDRSLACLGAFHQVYQTAGIVETLAQRSCLVCPHDARVPLPVVQDESQALVMTSPPYFNAVDYPRAHRLSVCWMNGYAPADLASRRQYIGLRYAAECVPDQWLATRPHIRSLLPSVILTHGSFSKRLCAFFADLEVVLHQIWRVLQPGGHAVFVIADNRLKGERIASHAVLTALARDTGLIEIETTPRAIAQLRRRFPVGPFGFDGPMTHEYLLVFRKPRR